MHIAVQAPLSRAVFHKAEIPWILAGAIIPDIPWIFQRIFLYLQLADPYRTKLYFSAQSSLLLCLLLCLAISPLAKRPQATCILLAGNCLAHLLLDSLQVKWGNGVHLLIPFSYHSLGFNLLWPEHLAVNIISSGGFFYLIFSSPEIYRKPISINIPFRWHISLLAVLLYLLLPFACIKPLQENNFRFIQTLMDKDWRTGKIIELDRTTYSEKHTSITTFAGETISLSGDLPQHSGIISLRGRFISPSQIQANTVHQHTSFRDHASLVGLALSLFIWVYMLFHNFHQLNCSRNQQ